MGLTSRAYTDIVPQDESVEAAVDLVRIVPFALRFVAHPQTPPCPNRMEAGEKEASVLAPTYPVYGRRNQ